MTKSRMRRMPRFFRRRSESVKVAQRSIHRVDLFEVGNVVAKIDLRRGEKGAVMAFSIHSQVFEVVQLRSNAVQVANPVVIAVGETSGINLVKNRVLPPLMAFRIYCFPRILCNDNNAWEEEPRNKYEYFGPLPTCNSFLIIFGFPEESVRCPFQPSPVSMPPSAYLSYCVASPMTTDVHTRMRACTLGRRIMEVRLRKNVLHHL